MKPSSVNVGALGMTEIYQERQARGKGGALMDAAAEVERRAGELRPVCHALAQEDFRV